MALYDKYTLHSVDCLVAIYLYIATCMLLVTIIPLKRNFRTLSLRFSRFWTDLRHNILMDMSVVFSFEKGTYLPFKVVGFS